MEVKMNDQAVEPKGRWKSRGEGVRKDIRRFRRAGHSGLARKSGQEAPSPS